MSSSAAQFVLNIINLSSHSDDIAVLAQPAEESLVVTVKVVSNSSPSAISQFLSAILHLRPHSDIIAKIKPVDESLVLTLRVSGESLIDLERSQLVQIGVDSSDSLLASPPHTPSKPDNPATPNLTHARFIAPFGPSRVPLVTPASVTNARIV